MNAEANIPHIIKIYCWYVLFLKEMFLKEMFLKELYFLDRGSTY